jgi:hypothetical protein
MKNLIFALLLISYNASATDLNLNSLGFSDKDTATSPQLQKNLEERRFYLRQHQVWGLVSAASLGLAVISGGEGDLPPEHAVFAGIAAASYAAAAFTAWKAPELPHGKEYGGSAWHRRLIWIHLPGMLLTPVLGYMAAKKLDRGEKLEGVEKYHKDVAFVTAVSVALSALTVSIDF